MNLPKDIPALAGDNTTIPGKFSFEVTPGWRICRYDSLNWAVMQHNPPAAKGDGTMSRDTWDVAGYYGHQLDFALRNLVRKAALHSAPQSVRDLLDALTALERAVERVGAQLREAADGASAPEAKTMLAGG